MTHTDLLNKGDSLKFTLPYILVFHFLTTVIIANAKTTGVLEGWVMDAQTGEPVAGANIFLKGTVMGGLAGPDGLFFIPNIPVGEYSVVVVMMGYVSYQIDHVWISSDAPLLLPVEIQRSPKNMEWQYLTLPFSPAVSCLTPVAMTIPRMELVSLPAFRVEQVLYAFPPFYLGAFQSWEYAIDGVALPGRKYARLFHALPPQVITELTLHTTRPGGKALSGQINAATTEDITAFQGQMQLISDILGMVQSDHASQFRVRVQGPLPFYLPSTFVVAAGMNLSDTPYREFLTPTFDFPVQQTADIYLKSTIRALPPLELRLQSLISLYQSIEYDPAWERYPRGLPEVKNHHYWLHVGGEYEFNPYFWLKTDLTYLDHDQSIFTAQHKNITASLSYLTYDEQGKVVYPQSISAELYKPVWFDGHDAITTASVEVQSHLYHNHDLRFGVNLEQFRLDLDYQEVMPDSSQWSEIYRAVPRSAAVYLTHHWSPKMWQIQTGLRLEQMTPAAAWSEIAGSKSRFGASPALEIRFSPSVDEQWCGATRWRHQPPPFHTFYSGQPGNGYHLLEMESLFQTAMSYQRTFQDVYRFTLGYQYQQYTQIAQETAEHRWESSGQFTLDRVSLQYRHGPVWFDRAEMTASIEYYWWRASKVNVTSPFWQQRHGVTAQLQMAIAPLWYVHLLGIATVDQYADQTYRHHQIDVRIRYFPRQHLSLVGDVLNLTHQTITPVFDPQRRFFNQELDGSPVFRDGFQIILGMTYDF